MFNSLF